MALTEKQEDEIRRTLFIFKNELDFNRKFKKTHPDAVHQNLSKLEDYVSHVGKLLKEIDDQRVRLAKKTKKL